MNDQHTPNPYAPTQLAGQVFRPEPSAATRSPTLGVLAVTLGGIILSGSAFGMILGIITALMAFEASLESAFLVPLGMIVGGMTAGICGLPVVIVALCLSAPVIRLSKGWLPHQTRNFAMICGFASGFAPLVLTDIWDPSLYLVAIVPGLFGAVGTWIFARMIYRPRKASRPGKESQLPVDEPPINVATLAEQSTDNVP